jgi:tetratricopeptide (TPR) repeat protein
MAGMDSRQRGDMMDDATQHNQQLAIYRRNLGYLLEQAAQFGGERMSPLPVRNQLHETRAMIATLKGRLHEHGVLVTDDPDDFPSGQPDVLSTQTRLDGIPLDSVPEIATLPLGSRMPYAPNPHFVGRDEELLALAQALKGGARVALGPRAAATGLGGIGKTNVAVEFVHRYGQYFAGGVFWLSFADPAAVPGEVAACGGPGLLDLHPAFGNLKQDDQVQLVRQAWQQGLPRLLVFDNCEDPTLIEAWAQRWPGPLQVQTQRLTVLARQSSIELLQQLAPRLTDTEADAIARELGDLPLALQLAGSYLAQFERTTVTTYLAELTSAAVIHHPSLEGWHDEDVSLTAHDRHVGRTFLVSYQHLDPETLTDALAIRLLVRAGCLAPGESIPVDLLLATADLDVESTQGQLVFQRLFNLGLLTLEAEGTVQIHRLIHSFVYTIVPATNALSMVEQELINRVYIINETGFPNTMYPLVPHLRWATRQMEYRTDMSIAALCMNLAFYLHATGEYNPARPLYERALVIRETVLGPYHPDTARSLNNLAGLLEAMGNYSEARPLYERALAIREQELGPFHQDTASSLNNLAALLETMGNYSEARPLYERALAIREQELGPFHQDTASSLNNLASLLQSIGEYSEARPLYERALVICEQVLKPNHPDIASSLNNLGSLLVDIGDYGGAQPLFERALTICEQELGPTHPDTARTLNNLAELLADRGNYSEARGLYERSLAICEQELGPTHPHTASSLNNLAGLLESLGEYIKALPLYERSLAIYEQVLGPTHPDTARSLNNLAVLLESLGEYARAYPLYERALTIYEQELGPTHPNTETIRRNMKKLKSAAQKQVSPENPD